MVHRDPLACRRALSALPQRACGCTTRSCPSTAQTAVSSSRSRLVRHARLQGRLPEVAIAIYLMTTRIKGTSSMNMHREIGTTQKTAGYMCRRIRKCWEQGRSPYEGRSRSTRSTERQGEEQALQQQEGPRWQWNGRQCCRRRAKDRSSNQISAAVVGGTKRADLHLFTHELIDVDTEVFTDDLKSYAGLQNHSVVRHGVGEYVNDGTYHRMSPAHLRRYVGEFAGRHNQRPCDTEVQIRMMAHA